MKNVALFIIATSSLFLSLSIGYYLNFYLPNIEKNKSTKLIECYKNVENSWSYFTSVEMRIKDKNQADQADLAVIEGKKECFDFYGYGR
jgi:uncharacterized membrane protein